jgi:hypothetical protein
MGVPKFLTRIAVADSDLGYAIGRVQNQPE